MMYPKLGEPLCCCRKSIPNVRFGAINWSELREGTFVSETGIWEAALLSRENPPKCTFWSYKLVQAVGGYFYIGNSNLIDRPATAEKHSQKYVFEPQSLPDSRRALLELKPGPPKGPRQPPQGPPWRSKCGARLGGSAKSHKIDSRR